MGLVWGLEDSFYTQAIRILPRALSPTEFFSSALHKGLSLSAVLLERLACKSQGSSFSLCLSSTRMTGMHHYTWLLCGC